MTPLEQYFTAFRENVIGNRHAFTTPYGKQHIVYADWTASGRLYNPIEQVLLHEIGPLVGNTHTETTITGSTMTHAYKKSLSIIKQHVGANADDVIISCESGMTGVVNKLQRMLGLRIPERFQKYIQIPKEERPIVFVTHMEHHSNQTSWIETVADVEIIAANAEGLPDIADLERMLQIYAHRKQKIAAITSCSNVTGVLTNYYEIAEVVHRHGGVCFVDFAASAPYIPIDMHPANPIQKLDAIYFSMHKFLGGPGSTGILVFDKNLYHNATPDKPGGGTVRWTNPWGEHLFIEDIEAREDGGTPAFLQTIKAALCVRLKEQMGIDNMLKREEELLDLIWEKMDKIPNLHVLADNIRKRLGIISFYIDNLHYNLAVRILNDRFGVQTRGGCSCAGTYGHYLYNISQTASKQIEHNVLACNFTTKPGWIRMSIHPVMSNEEVLYILDCIKALAENHIEWANEYVYNPQTNEYQYQYNPEGAMVEKWLGEGKPKLPSEPQKQISLN